MFDLTHPFFRPLWRRICLSVFLVAWAAFEFATGSTFWGVLVGALAIWVMRSLFFAAEDWDKPDSD